MTPTTGNPPSGDRPHPAPVRQPPGRRWAARLAVAALAVWATVDLLRAVLAVGRYEARILVVTHGAPDLGLPVFAYELFDFLLPIGLEVPTVADRAWLLVTAGTAVAVLGWLRQARPAVAAPDVPARRWLVSLLVAGGLHLLVRVYDALIAVGGPAHGTALDTRPVAYPLWTAGTVSVVVAAALGVRVVRRAGGLPAVDDSPGGRPPVRA
ncbi:hypothetical protein [Micromonospora cathayae]|uniref:Uncharacterized protein n=1 Tax=Micromonospora cathayae TaxID=3028804 RepID=A0ABY7ZJF2_9ACTN|nr:hypothetical protein [Micromonospora sp. HUAS 3]WDZ82638.1 hypothetical protein PVK37_19415 [Micromonospora sp. HUAS 3]